MKALARHAAGALDAFYDEVRRTPATAKFFTSDAAMGHAKAKQVEHWRALFGGPVDQATFARSQAVGNVHARIGLEPNWYIGGYARLLERMIVRMIRRSPGGLLDMDLAISAYFKAEEQARTDVVDRMAGALARMAGGDFTTPLTDLPPAFARIEQDFERMRQGINVALGQVSNASEAINKALIAGSARQVDQGVQLVSRSGEAFTAIVGRVTEIAGLAETIAGLAQTQADNLEQVNTAVHEMDVMTQHNAAMVEQSNAASRSLATQASELAQTVTAFRLETRRAGAAPVVPLRRHPLPAAAPVQRAPPARAASAVAAPSEDWSEF